MPCFSLFSFGYILQEAVDVMRPAIIEHVIVPPRPLDRYKHLQDKGTRTKSYKGWPKSDKIKSELIDDGFFYLGEIDRVQCSFCGGVLHSFKESDNVHIEHYRHFPKCKTFNDTDTEEDAALFRHVLQITNPNQADCSASSDGTSDTELVKQLKNLKLAPNTTCPRHKYYALYKDRLRTFDTWPTNHHLKKEKLADAGLFYAGRYL